MKITVSYKDKAIKPVELNNVTKIKIGSNITGIEFEGESIKNAAITSDKDIFISHENGLLIIAKNTFCSISIED